MTTFPLGKITAAIAATGLVGAFAFVFLSLKSTSYEKTLMKLGFVEIRLRPTKVGLFFADGEVLRNSAVIVVDTGASRTILDKSSADRWGVCYAPAEGRGTGAGASNLESFTASGVSLLIDGFDLELNSLCVIDLSHMKQTMAARGLETLDVILGADVMRAREAKVDYARSSLFLKRTVRPSKNEPQQG